MSHKQSQNCLPWQCNKFSSGDTSIVFLIKLAYSHTIPANDDDDDDNDDDVDDGTIAANDDDDDDDDDDDNDNDDDDLVFDVLFNII